MTTQDIIREFDAAKTTTKNRIIRSAHKATLRARSALHLLKIALASAPVGAALAVAITWGIL